MYLDTKLHLDTSKFWLMLDKFNVPEGLDGKKG
jgi:hypothetical protein